LPKADAWRRRLRTLRAMALLCRARLLVDWIALDRWRDSLGLADRTGVRADEARRFAADVEWAAGRLPFEIKCLPRAMALSWMLRRAGITHSVVIAARPPQRRGANDNLHAWVEVAGETVLGELPGPWVETLRLGN